MAGPVAEADATCHGALAAAAADALIALIGPAIGQGLVVDAACGGGLLAAQVAAAGYEVRGGDPSPERVALARARVPQGRFLPATLMTVDLPPARAIAAVGEAVSTQIAPGDEVALSRFAARAYAALERGGILLIDAAAPGRGDGGTGFVEGPGWAAGSDSREVDATMLRRTTTLFVETAGGWQRHRAHATLSLWTPPAMIALLRAAGLTVEAGDRYAGLALPPGLIRYTAQREGAGRPRTAGATVRPVPRPARPVPASAFRQRRAARGRRRSRS